MLRLRRTPLEPRIELVPLIDVMMFLLTFFVYAQVLTTRVAIVPMELKRFSSGTEAKVPPACSVSIDLDGRVWVDRRESSLDALSGMVEERRKADGRTVVYLAVADGKGAVDRAPILQDVWERLKGSGLTVNIVGKPAPARTVQPGAAPAAPSVPTTTPSNPTPAGPGSQGNQGQP
jgi:biopolymer transport protein ExbD